MKKKVVLLITILCCLLSGCTIDASQAPIFVKIRSQCRTMLMGDINDSAVWGSNQNHEHKFENNSGQHGRGTPSKPEW